MRRSARLWQTASGLCCAAALCGGCQNGYPIAATQCDEWCDASQALQCGSYSPAGCVALCETEHLTRSECSVYFNEALTCLRSTPESELECHSWLYTNQVPCSTEQKHLYDCAGFYSPNINGHPVNPL